MNSGINLNETLSGLGVLNDRLANLNARIGKPRPSQVSGKDASGPMGILETSRQVRIALSYAHDLVQELEAQL